jgi:hypothetical protein
MEYRSRSVYVRRLAGLGVITALLATAFAPAMAASQGSPTAPPSFSARSIAKVIATTTPDSVRLNRTAGDDARTTQAQATKSGSFFKTRTGLLVIAVMAAGTGYAVYSAKQDRIRGSIR